MVKSRPLNSLSLPEIGRSRATVYQWFSQQLRVELTSVQWQALAEGRQAQFFAVLAENDLAVEVQAYLEAVASLAKAEEAALLLASDFTHAFLLDEHSSALPYASAYEADGNGQLYGASAKIMHYFLQARGLVLNADFKEPEDHIAIYLAVLAHMANGDGGVDKGLTLAEQQRFLQEALLPWLPDFVDKCQALPLHSQVYPALLRLLQAFVAQDQAFLSTYASAA
ncbi:MAG: molecular chaperone TorD [Neisseriaceae bacterium]|nr:molecular chaperone TorD [Neisseriaceae bacterium]MBP6861430.1 molecular chaperone TorD [Neisseriaceae bacterium]